MKFYMKLNDHGIHKIASNADRHHLEKVFVKHINGKWVFVSTDQIRLAVVDAVPSSDSEPDKSLTYVIDLDQFRLKDNKGTLNGSTMRFFTCEPEESYLPDIGAALKTIKDGLKDHTGMIGLHSKDFVFAGMFFKNTDTVVMYNSGPRRPIIMVDWMENKYFFVSPKVID